MIPLHDNIPSRITPGVNWALIVICSLVFLLQQAVPAGQPGLIDYFGMIPARISDPNVNIEIVEAVRQVRTPRGIALQKFTRAAPPPVIPPILTMFTCIFLHGGWLHIIGNMWFLHIFGDNIEDRFGHLKYLLFYVGCGLAASAVHYLSDPTSTVPTIGASGAIAGVMGAYFVWYRDAQVQSLVPIGPFLTILQIPAPIFLGLWFALQLFSGTFSGQAAGVAWWAHIGGFAAGAIIAWTTGHTGAVRPPNPQRRASGGRVNFRRYPPDSRFGE